MPSISVRGPTKARFQKKCKELGIAMSTKLEEIIRNFLGDQPSVRDQGIKAIIALQGLMGILETREDAGIGWDTMSSDEQRNTLAAYLATQGKKPKLKIISFEVDAEGDPDRTRNLELPGYKFHDMNKVGTKAVIRFIRND